MALLEVRGGRWGYSTDQGTYYPAQAVDFEVQPGEIVMLTGPNGCGKTTILRGLLGLVARHSGDVAWGVSRTDIGYVRQESAIDRSIPATVMDIVRTGDPARWAHGRREANRALEQVGMVEKSEVLFAQLSGGQRQRVLIARSLVGRPKLLLLDEPTINVDAHTAQKIGQMLARLASEGLGIVGTSHVTGWVAASREIPIRQTESGG
jgi:zinc transport system ATP-binding protein